MYCSQFMTSIQVPIRSNWPVSASSASGAQSAVVKSGSLAALTSRFTTASKSRTFRDSSPPVPALALMLVMPARGAGRGAR